MRTGRENRVEAASHDQRSALNATLPAEEAPLPDHRAEAAALYWNPGAAPPLSQQQIIDLYNAEEQQVIFANLHRLSGRARAVARDFDMPIELGLPTTENRWNPNDNTIYLDPEKLLHADIRELRFIICHEGGHRIISKPKLIKADLYAQPGFPLEYNIHEDPRDNNYTAQGDIGFDLDCGHRYALELVRASEIAHERCDQAGVHLIPRQLQAMGELHRIWFAERYNQRIGELDLPDDLISSVHAVADPALRSDLSPEILAAVEAALPGARDYWNCYPLKEEAADLEKVYTYADYAHTILETRVWPHIQPLVEMDLHDQMLLDLLENLLGGAQPEAHARHSSGDSAPALDGDVASAPVDRSTPGPLQPQDDPSDEGGASGRDESAQFPHLSDEAPGVSAAPGEPADPSLPSPDNSNADSDHFGALSQPSESEDPDHSSEQSALNRLRDIAREKLSGKPPGQMLSLDELSPDELAELEDLISKIPSNLRIEVQAQAEDELEKLREIIAEALKGAADGVEPEVELAAYRQARSEPAPPEPVHPDSPEPEFSKEEIRNIDRVQTVRKEVAPLITNYREAIQRALFRKLEEVPEFVDIASAAEIDFDELIDGLCQGKAIYEIDAGINPERKAPPPLAVTLLIDLSASMAQGNKIYETFKSAVFLTDLLEQIGVQVEVLGFNASLHVFKSYEDSLSDEVWAKMGGMIEHTSTQSAAYNDDGWALATAADRQMQIQSHDKIILVMSDGHPRPSPKHSGAQWELTDVVTKIVTNNPQLVAGLGLGQGTEHVGDYFPLSLANLSAEELAEQMADFIADLIINYAEHRARYIQECQSAGGRDDA